MDDERTVNSEEIVIDDSVKDHELVQEEADASKVETKELTGKEPESGKSDVTGDHEEESETAALLAKDESNVTDDIVEKEMELIVQDKNGGDDESDTEATALISKASSVEKMEKSD